jgi:hypothetical protein
MAVAGAGAETVVLTGLLWIVLRVQKRACAVWKLLICALAFASVSWIPWVGLPLGYAVLVVTVWKFTKADLVPDVLFTMAIVRALMFCFNLFVLGWAMGDLREVRARTADLATNTVAASSAATAGPAKGDGRVSALLAENNVVLAGVTGTPRQRLALIRAAGKGITLAPGEAADVKLSGRFTRVKCLEIRADSVTIEIDGQTAELFCRKVK